MSPFIRRGDITSNINGQKSMRVNDSGIDSHILPNSWFLYFVVKDGLVYCVYATFNNISCYIVAASFIGGGNGVPRENHQPVASH